MISIAATILLWSTKGIYQDQSGSDLYKRSLPSIMTLKVHAKNGDEITGTAFLTKTPGIAVTAWHVVSEGGSAVAKFADGQEFDVSGVIDKDEKRDIALIRVKVSGREGLEMASKDPEIGSKAFVIGAPRGLDFTIADGLISQLRTVDDRKVIQFSCPVSPGDSGGPLLSSDGKVLGVVSFGRIDGADLNFAVPIAFAAGLDSTLPTTPWSSVKSTLPVPFSAGGRHFNPDHLGFPSWDGTRDIGYQKERNWWRVALIYKPGEALLPENAAIGLISFLRGNDQKTAKRAITLYQANRWRGMIREYIETKNVAALEATKGELKLQTKRFVLSGELFADDPLRILFHGVHGAKKAGFYITVYFDNGTSRGMNKDEASRLLRELDRWTDMLKDEGLDLDKLTTDA